MNMKILNFLKQLQLLKLDHKISVLSDHKNIILFLKKTSKALFSLPIKFRVHAFRKTSGDILMFFSVNQLENNNTSGNKESVVYY